jgi:hypothetical protein
MDRSQALLHCTIQQELSAAWCKEQMGCIISLARVVRCTQGSIPDVTGGTAERVRSGAPAQLGCCDWIVTHSHTPSGFLACLKIRYPFQGPKTTLARRLVRLFGQTSSFKVPTTEYSTHTHG